MELSLKYQVSKYCNSFLNDLAVLGIVGQGEEYVEQELPRQLAQSRLLGDLHKQGGAVQILINAAACTGLSLGGGLGHRVDLMNPGYKGSDHSGPL